MSFIFKGKCGEKHTLFLYEKLEAGSGSRRWNKVEHHMIMKRERELRSSGFTSVSYPCASAAYHDMRPAVNCNRPYPAEPLCTDFGERQ